MHATSHCSRTSRCTLTLRWLTVQAEVRKLARAMCTTADWVATNVHPAGCSAGPMWTTSLCRHRHPIYCSDSRPGTRVNTGVRVKGAFRRNRERRAQRAGKPPKPGFRVGAAFRTKPGTRARTGVSGRREKGQSNVWPWKSGGAGATAQKS